MAARTRIPRSRPPQVGSSEIMVVTCVSPKTKTRSKKSSSGLTRSSPWEASTRETLTTHCPADGVPPAFGGTPTRRMSFLTLPNGYVPAAQYTHPVSCQLLGVLGDSMARTVHWFCVLA